MHNPVVRTAFHFNLTSDSMFSIRAEFETSWIRANMSHWATTQALVALITPDNWNLPDLECRANQSDGWPGQSPDVSASLAAPLYRHYLRRILFQSVRFMVGRCGAWRREHQRLLPPRRTLHRSSWPLFRSSQFILGSTKRQRRGAPGSFRMIAIRTSIQYAMSHVMRTAAKFATST